jgi:hypothetical protein
MAPGFQPTFPERLWCCLYFVSQNRMVRRNMDLGSWIRVYTWKLMSNKRPPVVSGALPWLGQKRHPQLSWGWYRMFCSHGPCDSMSVSVGADNPA